VELRALVVCAMLVVVPVATRADENLRAIEIAEVHRTYVAALATSLDDVPSVAARAALAIGRTKDRAGVAPLRAHLETGRVDPGVRAMCAYGLGLLADRPSLERLIALARHDSSSAVRYAAIDAVGRIVIAEPQAATLELANDTLNVVRSDDDATVRAHAAAQLDAFRGSPAAHTIVAGLERAQESERDETVRWHTAWAIFRGFATAADAPFLARALHDRNELVRVEAARAWGRREDSGAAAIVRTALDDPSWRVQLEAREALRRIAHLAPQDHLTVTPAVHLPKIARVPSALAPTRAALATTMGEPRSAYAAPDPATLPLPGFASPRTASDLASLRPGPRPRVTVATTKGTFVIALAPEWAPATVANFLALAQRKYYDGNRWFRIVPDFVVQTGDPSDDGKGDAGYAIPAEENPLEQRSGAIAMGLNYAGSGAIRDSAGTQFYLTLSPQLHLDRDFSVFGVVRTGFEVLAHLIESDRIVSVTRLSDG